MLPLSHSPYQLSTIKSRGGMLATGFWSLVSGRWSLSTDCWLLVDGCFLQKGERHKKDDIII
jgi:hypothetical protein